MTNWPYFDRHFWIIFVKFRAQGGYSLYLDIEFIEKNARNPHLYSKCISYILLGFAYRWQKLYQLIFEFPIIGSDFCPPWACLCYRTTLRFDFLHYCLRYVMRKPRFSGTCIDWWVINKNVIFSVPASFLLAVRFCIHTHAQYYTILSKLSSLYWRTVPWNVCFIYAPCIT